MGLFEILHPKAAARLDLLTRRVSTLMATAGIDELSDPQLADVIAEVRAGHQIKATELYCTATGAGVGEAQLAVAELRERLEQ